MISDHINRVPKLRVVITTVDPSNGVIEGVVLGGSARRLAIFDVPPGFVWPKEGEQWAIYEENGYWVLGGKFPSEEELNELQSLRPGESLDERAGDLRRSVRSSITGYLLCDGAEYEIADYPALAQALDATGETFNVPDLRVDNEPDWFVKT